MNQYCHTMERKIKPTPLVSAICLNYILLFIQKSKVLERAGHHEVQECVEDKTIPGEIDKEKLIQFSERIVTHSQTIQEYVDEHASENIAEELFYKIANVKSIMRNFDDDCLPDAQVKDLIYHFVVIKPYICDIISAFCSLKNISREEFESMQVRN